MCALLFIIASCSKTDNLDAYDDDGDGDDVDDDEVDDA